MKKLEKLELISDIGRELQSRMTYSDIAAFLTEFGINTKKETSNINSKWVYVKELLSGESEQIILKIADEIGIQHDFKDFDIDIKTVDVWEPFHFKLFISHLAKFREKAHLLKMALKKYGVSSFVAHDDIEPTREWLVEIEKALFSMDGLVAILIPEFNLSKWTDQEVGIAIGLQKLVIPIRKGFDPYGFIGKFQGFNANGKTVEEVAKGIAEILYQHKKTKFIMINSISSLITNSTEVKDIENYLSVIEDFSFITKDILEILQSKYSNSNTIMANEELKIKIEKLLEKNGISIIREDSDTGTTSFEDIVPF